jgi:hypothetical protein
VTTPGYQVLDQALLLRPSLARADDYDAALHLLEVLQREFYDQLEANGEGGACAELALAIVPVDATGTVGPPVYWSIINGMRPASS